jgi:hypothetical protein
MRPWWSVLSRANKPADCLDTGPTKGLFSSIYFLVAKEGQLNWRRESTDLHAIFFWQKGVIYHVSSTDRTTDQTTDQPTTDKTTDETTDQPTDQPTDKTADKTTDKTTDETTDRTTGGARTTVSRRVQCLGTSIYPLDFNSHQPVCTKLTRT